MDYYVVINGTQSGPYTIGQLRAMWTSGALTSDTQYWCEGLQDWKPLRDIALNFEASENIPAPTIPEIVRAKGADDIDKSDKRILPALLLFLTLGQFGVHRFYAGRASGLLFPFLLIIALIGLANPKIKELGGYVGGPLVFIFGGLPLAVLLLVDFIQIITGNFKDAQGRSINRWT